MDEVTTALARRWRAARGFRWYRGMMDDEDNEVCRILADGTAEYWPGHGFNKPMPPDALPDLDDPITRGAAPLMARAAWGDPRLHARPIHPGWWHIERVGEDDHEWLRYSGRWGEGDPQDQPITEKTEIEALIAALEAAPEVAKCPPTT